MKRAYILLDVGGTCIKGSVADYEGNIGENVICADAHARESKEVIFDNMAKLIRQLVAQTNGMQIAGVGMAFPGPFNYKEGISLLKGLGKYESIYGIPIEKEIKKRVKETVNSEFYFLHDIEAFAIGESQYGDARGCGKIFCICIGTGAGSAFVRNGMVIKKEEEGVPLNGWIYLTPYKDSIIDDYISARGLADISKKILGQELNGKELFEKCRAKDLEAIKVFDEFGENLQESILPFVEKFRPSAVVFGGQISKSFQYFGKRFEWECVKRNIKIYLEPDTSVKAMQGLFVKMKREGRYAKS